MKRGTSILEVIVYISVLIVMTVAIIIGIIQMAQVFGKTRNERKVALAGENAIDRIVREARLAVSIQSVSCSGQPCLDINSLSAFDASTSSTAEKKVTLTSGRLVLTPDVSNPAVTEYLTPPDVTISNFVVTQLATTYLSKTSISKGVRVSFTVSTGVGKYLATHDYVGAAVLRHSYP